jgi:hypothetical protein
MRRIAGLSLKTHRLQDRLIDLFHSIMPLGIASASGRHPYGQVGLLNKPPHRIDQPIGIPRRY